MADNAFTANGRVKAPASVTPAKLKAIKALVEDTMSGNRIARGRLEETLTSSDAIFSYAHLTNLNFLPQYDRAPRTWTSIAGTHRVSDFRKPVLYSIATEWDGLDRAGDDPEGVAPVVPEGGQYPYAYMKGEEAISGGIAKRGFKTDFTFEAFINDSVGFIAALPGEMLRVALDTEEYEVYGALLNGVGAGQQLAGGVIPGGTTTITPNAVFSRDALLRGLLELGDRKINGRQVAISAFNLIVPVGQKRFVDFAINQALTLIVNGTKTYAAPSGYNPFADVTVIESVYMTGTKWFLLPAKGATARPVLDRGLLIGHESPELRVENATGSYVGGSAVSPFEGSFDNDSATFRLRQIGGGILWSPSLVLYSLGTGA